jgi:hypothetical protein
MSRPLLLAALYFVTACVSVNAAPLVDLAVVDRDNGQWLPDVSHRGDRWIAGTPGHRYGVRLTNTSGQRVLVVLSVDGVNAVTGETAHPSQAGYVLEPWQSSEIAGWRKSYDDIAQFVFTDLHDSYAARTGRPDDVGVIGVAVFTEAPPIHSQHRAPPVASDRYESRRSAKSAAPAGESVQRDSASSDSHAAQGLGTGHGAREWSPVLRTGFVRASRHPAQVSQLRYDDHATLVARGVFPRGPRHRHDDRPRAFPHGFVADPPPRW